MLSTKNILIFFLILAIVIGCKNRYSWFQKENVAYIIDINQSARVFPHRVNSVGKLKDIWDVGFRSFETDAYFYDDNTSYFRVGHDNSAMGGSLTALLASVDYNQIERIWLDFKNLNIENHLSSLRYLQHLDEKFQIKKKIIIESSTTLEFFKKFKDDGWHISYYLPTETIFKLLENNEVQSLKDIASKIAIQSKIQNLSAISFDDKLYPFVKQYLEPQIDKNIVYHTWWGPDIYRYNFKTKLKKDKLFFDKRVKTILVRFKSKHSI